jgi:MraZ protein
MFLGQYVHSIDSKSRLTVPARFRATLASGGYIVQGYERNLMVYTTETFERLATRTYSHSTTDPEVRNLRRFIFGGAHQVSLDSTGRILIPDFLKEFAGLDDDATIVGTGEYFEIWNPDEWEKKRVTLTDPESNAERFTAFDLSTE